MGPVHAAPGLADVAARIATIQSRIDAATGGHGAAPTVAGATADAQVLSTEATGSFPVDVAASPGSADLAGRLPAAGAPWVDAITAAAEEAGIDPALFAAVVQHESGFDPAARSHAGAIGLAQLMPGTARGLGVDPTDPLENLAGGARYLRRQLDRFGSVELALAAYNAGPTRVVEAGGVPRIPETLAYVGRVTATWERLR